MGTNLHDVGPSLVAVQPAGDPFQRLELLIRSLSRERRDGCLRGPGSAGLPRLSLGVRRQQGLCSRRRNQGTRDDLWA